MRDHRRLALLILIMTVVSLAVGGTAIGILYSVSISEQRERLIGLVKSQARLIEAMARFDRANVKDKGGVTPEVLQQVRDAYENFDFSGLGESGELNIARRGADGNIEFLLSYPRNQGVDRRRMMWVPNRDEPTRAALDGRSGAMFGTDHHGIRVLAAYEPVLGMGLVAKIDLAEVREPFIRAAIVVCATTAFLILIGARLFWVVGEPMVRKLGESESRFRQLFDNMSTGAAVLRADRGGRDFVVEDLNQAAERIGGIARTTAIGRSLFELFPGRTAAGMLKMVRRVWKGGIPQPFAPVLFHDRRLDGWREGYVYRLPNNDVVVLFEDVSERRQAEEALRESEARYRRLFDESPTPILIIDPVTTRVVGFNKIVLNVLGYTAAEFANTGIADWEARDDAAHVRQRIDDTMKSGRADFETVWRSKSGQLRSVILNIRVLDDSGRPVMHCVITDLTERVEAEKRAHDLHEQLLRVGRINEMGQMVSAIGHEVKQPLTAALNYVNACRRLLQASPVAVARTVEIMVKAASEIERAGTFVRRIGDFTQHRTSTPAVVDLDEAITETVAVVQAGADPAAVPIKMNLNPSASRVVADRTYLQQVLLNLLRNAVEATANAPHPSITVATGVDGSNVLVAVRDSGAGLDAAVVERLFQPFVTTKSGGVGIGLSICHSIVQENGGRIWAEPNPGGGAVFTFTVPRAATTGHGQRGYP